jgi:prepilin-type N-terminal cleavage/methylation domain-containing protein
MPLRRSPVCPPTGSAASGLDPTRRAGFTLPELLIVLCLISILFGLAVARIAAAADRTAVRSAAADAATVFTAARTAALYRRAPVAVIIDTLSRTIAARSGAVLLVRRDLGGVYGVRLSVSRDSMAFDARGLGLGAANLSLVARRGRAVDTLFLSRAGRVRY